MMNPIQETLDTREKSYGTYAKVSWTAQTLKDAIRTGKGWEQMEPHMRESLDMICNKMARIANGNPFYADSWHDIAGYAKLVEIELEKA